MNVEDNLQQVFKKAFENYQPIHAAQVLHYNSTDIQQRYDNKDITCIINGPMDSMKNKLIDVDLTENIKLLDDVSKLTPDERKKKSSAW
jgi:hypothetical protein